jgi:tRNA-guanine family transglycosylase
MGQLEIFCAAVNDDTLPSQPLRNILVNTPNEGHSMNSISNTLKFFKYAQCKHTFLDSGGFQIIVSEEAGKEITFDATKKLEMSNRGINIAPEHIINVAMLMQPDIVSALDFPIRKFVDKNDQDKEFMRKFGYNVTWARKTAKLRKERCPHIKLLIPVQAYDVEQFNEFFYSIKDVEFDGFSLPVRNFEAHEIALFLIAFYKLGIPMVHILGTSKLLTTACGAYMARHYFEWVSLDATTWHQSAKYNHYINSFSLTAVDVSSNVIINEDIKIDCQCPWCKGKTFTYIKYLPYTEKTSLLRCHNWWVIERAAKELYEHCDTVFTLKQHLLARCPDIEDIEKLCSVLSIIDAMKERKIEEILAVCRLNSTAAAA